jgi:AcrR family transcriptional regulator
MQGHEPRPRPSNGMRRGGPFDGLGPRALATLDTVEAAALGEFLRRGFQETTAERIAAASGVSVRTFFRYFPRGKEDVMVLQFRRWVQQLTWAMRVRPANESAWTALRAAVRMIPLLEAGEGISAGAVGIHREIARRDPGLHERMTPQHHALAEPLVEMAALRMSVDPQVDLRPRLMVHSMLAVAMVTWLAWLPDGDMDALATFERGLDLLEHGMTVGMATPRA